MNVLKSFINSFKFGNGNQNSQKQASNHQSNQNSSDDLQKLVVNYFKGSFGKIGIILPIVGIFMLISFQPVLMILGAILIFIFKPSKKATDQDIDQLVRQKEQACLNEGYQYCGIDPDDVALAEPIVLTRYIFQNASKAKGGLRLGKDNVLRAARCHTDCLYFCDARVTVYSVDYSLIDGNVYRNFTDYHYDDIVAIHTNDTAITVHYDDKTNYRIPANKIVFDVYPNSLVLEYMLPVQDFDQKLRAANSLVRMRKGR